MTNPKKKTGLSLIEAAERYLKLRQLVRREPLYSARRFTRLVGPMDVLDITDEHFNTFREQAKKVGFSRQTVRTTLADVRTIIIDVKGDEESGARKYPRAGDVEPAEPAQGDEIGDLSICDFALQYTEKAQIVRRELVYSANRFTRIMGPMRVSAINTDTLIEFREELLKHPLSPVTLEANVSDIRTLIRAARGVLIDPGRRVKKPRPVPKPIPLKTLEACWPHFDEWLKQWAVLSYLTALRLGDALNLQLILTNEIPETLQWQASKTEHVHRYPVPKWFHPWSTRRTLPFRRSNDFSKRMVRLAITSACEKADVPVWQPKFLRQYALTQWMKASPAAGQIIHGCGLNGVLKHYVDPLTILEEAVGKLFIPEFFRVGQQQEDEQPETDAAELFKGLDEKARAVMLQTMRVMLGQA